MLRLFFHFKIFTFIKSAKDALAENIKKLLTDMLTRTEPATEEFAEHLSTAIETHITSAEVVYTPASLLVPAGSTGGPLTAASPTALIGKLHFAKGDDAPESDLCKKAQPIVEKATAFSTTPNSR